MTWFFIDMEPLLIDGKQLKPILEPSAYVELLDLSAMLVRPRILKESCIRS